ncbi:hypothetical protein KJ596_01190 [Patescibacteria group bacterium]|nr:hypothetical protein [Patescibacteria group bacterium]MBU1868133.1 hypothetical protein [Patescibacteria group bacterium]
MAISVEKLPKSKVKITAKPTQKEIKEAVNKALRQLSEQIDIPGFRKGKAPLNMVRERINDTKLSMDALDILATDLFREAIKQHNLWPVSRPEVSLPKSPDSQKDIQELTQIKDFSIEYTVEIRPEIKLENYENLPVSKPSVMIKESEIEKAIQNIFTEWKGNQPVKEENEIATATTLSEAEQKATQAQQKNAETLAKIEKSHPDDEWAQIIGEIDLNSLKAKVKELLLSAKRADAEKMLEQQIFDTLIAQNPSFDIPESLINDQLEREEKQLRQQLERTKTSLDDFLKQRKQTLEEIKMKWRQVIEKNLKIELILQQIADEQKVAVEDEEVSREIKLVRDEKLKAQFEKPEQREYIKFMIRQTKTVKWLKDRVGKSG